MKQKQKRTKKNRLIIGILIILNLLLTTSLVTLVIILIKRKTSKEKPWVEDILSSDKEQPGLLEKSEPLSEKRDEISPVSVPLKEKDRSKGAWLTPLLLVLLLSAPFLFIGVARVNGSSMQPALNNEDYVIYSRWTDDLNIGDIILFERDGIRYIKRIYGIPGDTIEIDDAGSIMVNGKPRIIDNLIIMGATEARDITEQVLVNNQEYFVLGDHRSVSLDSRNSDIGMVQESEIFGVYLFSLRR